MNNAPLKYRYPGAQPFNTQQKQIFFGRNKDVQSLYQLLSLEKLVVLYSKSGLGKSSLINAGIIPQTEAESNFKSFSIRFGANVTEQQKTPSKTTIQHLTPNIERDTYLDKLIPDDNSFWYYIKKRQQQDKNCKGFLLIFDQFEELFTYPKEEIIQFKQGLKEIVNKQIPQRFRDALEQQFESNNVQLTEQELELFHKEIEIKILLAIRSDRISLLNELKDYLPNILRHCYELDALSIEQAEDAILNPALKKDTAFSSPSFDFEDESLNAILQFLTKDYSQKIESFQLQILCQNIEKKVIDKQLQKVNLTDIGDIESIYKNHYDNLIENIGTKEEQLAARKLIEEGLIFEEEERRLSLYEGQIAKSFGVSPDLLKKLVDSHLLRAEPSMQGGYTYELCHDTLVAPVLKSKTKRKAVENQQAREVELLALREKEEEAKRQIEKERKFREQAEENEKLAYKQSRIAKGISVIALLLAILAMVGFWRADKETDKATHLLEQLQEQQNLTKLQRDIAEEAVKSTKNLNQELKASLQQEAEATQLANNNKNKAIQVQNSLKKANLDMINLFIQLSDEAVLRLNYTEALRVLRKSKILVNGHRELGRRFMEMSFVYNEIGQPEIALGLLDTAIILYSIPSENQSINKYPYLKPQISAALEQLDNYWFQQISKRYYPEMIEIPEGKFCYGSLNTNDQICNDSLVFIHKLEVSRTEISVWQYHLYILASALEMNIAPEWGWQGNHPMVNVSWYESIAYCRWLNTYQYKELTYSIDGSFDNPNALENNQEIDWANAVNWSAKGYRLPSDQEWEYLARSGGFSNTRYSGNNEVNSVAWINSNSNNSTQSIDLLKPNNYGIVDLSGNASEWCWDWSTPGTKELYPPNTDKGEYPIIRGGSWKFSAKDAEVTYRGKAIPTSRENYIGFRVVSPR